MCVCICIYIYIYISPDTPYTHIYIYIWIDRYVCVYIHACMHACIHTYIHTYIHIYIYILYTSTNVNMFTCVLLIVTCISMFRTRLIRLHISIFVAVIFSVWCFVSLYLITPPMFFCCCVVLIRFRYTIRYYRILHYANVTIY